MMRFIGYTGNRGTNVRPENPDRMTNVRITRIISAPVRPILALVSTQMRLFDEPPVKAPRKRTNTSVRKTKDYPDGPYEWTEAQGRACFEAHAWAGSTHLVRAMQVAWMDDRPPCYPPPSVVDADTAITVLLNTFVRVHLRTRKEAHA